MSRQKGPYCALCGHEYRSKDGEFESAPFIAVNYSPGVSVRCTYCGQSSPPVAEKPWPELSKSAIEKFILCPARWGFNYLEHKREPSSKYAKFGIVGHGYGERWLKYGQLPQVNSLDPKSVETKAATSLLGGIPHAPPPTLPGLLAECEFHFAYDDGTGWPVHYMGYKDAWAPLASPPQENHTLVHDWKFVGNVHAEHNLTNDTIADDVQAIIYGFDDVRRGATHVWANWTYMPRGERGARPARACMPAADIAARMAKLNETGKKMLHLLQTRPPVSTLEAVGGKACSAYGMSCPHLSYCHVTFENQLPEIGGSQMAQMPPGMIANGAPPSPLDALLPGLTAPAAPPPFAVAAPPPFPVAAVNPPPPPQFNPAATYRVLWQGAPYDITGDKVPQALQGGATLLEAPAAPAPVAPPPAAVVAAPVPSTTGPAPGAPGRAPGRGRPRKAAAQAAAPGAEGIALDAFDTLLAGIRDAITEYLGG